MPVDFSILSDRSIVKTGKIFTAGHYTKCPFLIPSNSVLSANLKAYIYQEQSSIFSEIENLDGLTFEKDINSTNYFEQNSIHESVNFDPNKRAIWIDLKQQRTEGTDKPRVIIPTIIYVSAGKGDSETQSKLNDGYIRALTNGLLVVPNQFLVIGYPANISDLNLVLKQSYQPEVKIQFRFDSNPDLANLDGNASRPIGELKFDIELIPKHNTLT